MRPSLAARSPRPVAATLVVLCLVVASTGVSLTGHAAPSQPRATATRGPAAPALDSGIKGRVILGPLTPSTRIGETVREQPLETTLKIVHAEDESLVTTVQTLPNGRFTVALPPGSYIIESASTDAIRRPAIDPLPVTVPPDTVVEVTVTADSGMR